MSKLTLNELEQMKEECKMNGLREAADKVTYTLSYGDECGHGNCSSDCTLVCLSGCIHCPNDCAIKT